MGREPSPSESRIVPVGPCGRSVDNKTLQRAAAVIREGGIVAFPTDTLYGVACDARNPEAIGRLYKLKGREASKPVAVVVASAADVAGVAACEQGSAAGQVVAELLPGPFTAVLPRGEALPPQLNPGVPSLGVRVVPDSAPCATALCAAVGPGAALALTSANASGATSPLRIEDFTELHADIGLVLDGGEIPADSRAGSTVVDLSRPGELRILREGVAGGSAKAVATGLSAGLTAPVPGCSAPSHDKPSQAKAPLRSRSRSPLRQQSETK